MSNKSLAVLAFLFPLLLAAGIITIPFVSDYSDNLVTEAAAAQAARWFWGHIVSGVAFGISMVLAHNITRYVNSRTQTRAGEISLILLALGGCLLAMGLGADGVGAVAVRAGGSQASAFFEGSGMMVTGLFMAGVILYGFGLIFQISGLRRSGLISGRASGVLAAFAVIFMGASAIPSTAGLYVLALAAAVIYGSFGLLLLRR
jgi:hypothetical protein